MQKITHSCTAEELLALPLEEFQEIFKKLQLYYLDSYRGEVTEDFKELFQMVVRRDISNARPITYQGKIISITPVFVRNIGWLDEELGLEIWKSYRGLSIVNQTRPYDIPQSHIDYLKSLPYSIRRGLQNTWLQDVIDLEFIPQSVKIVPELMSAVGIDEINGWVFETKKDAIRLTETIADMLYQIDVAKEKALFDAKTDVVSNSDTKLKNIYYNVPIIFPELVNSGNIDFVTGNSISYLSDVRLIGKTEDIVYLPSKSYINHSKKFQKYIHTAIDNTKCLYADGGYIPVKEYDNVINLATELIQVALNNEITNLHKVINNIDLKNRILNKTTKSLTSDGIEIVIEKGIQDVCTYVDIFLTYPNGFKCKCTSYTHKKKTYEQTVNWLEYLDIVKIESNSLFLANYVSYETISKNNSDYCVTINTY